MRIYAETTFVVELALEQTEHAACRRILELAEQRAVELALPAFSIYEAYRALTGKKMGIRRITDAMDREVNDQLHRMEDFADLNGGVTELIAKLTKSLERAESRLTSLDSRLLDVAEILPLGPSQLRNRSGSLGFADAMVYASIQSDPKFGVGPSCFVTTNDSDFKELKSEMASRTCKLLFRFQDAVQYVENVLRREAPGS